MRKTIQAALVTAALALSFGTIAVPAQAGSGVEIQIGPNGFSIGIDTHRHHRRHHHDYPRYNQPAPWIDVVVWDEVGYWQDEWAYDRYGNQYRTGRRTWVTHSVQRNVRAFWDPQSGSYWYYDSQGRRTYYR